MMKLPLFLLLPTLAVALDSAGFFQHGLRPGNGLERKLQTVCESQFKDLEDCESANTEDCKGDDPSDSFCLDDDIATVFGDVAGEAITNDDICDLYQNQICVVSAGCCNGLCKSEYQDALQCFFDNFFDTDNLLECGTFSCDSGGSGGSCFSATSTVQVLGQGPVQMQDLQVGDQVLTGSPDNYKYQPVYAFGHLNKEALGAFYAIATKGNKALLEMTGGHLVYLAGKANPVRADSLQAGDVLVSIHGPTEITAIDVVEKKGLFNPLTADARLLVNEIAVSTYIALQENNLEHFQVVFDKRGDYKINLASHQTFAHLYLTPFRMLCMGISSQLCRALDADGIPLYIGLGMKLVGWVGEQNVLVQLVFFLLTIPIYVSLLAIEKLVGSSVAPLAVFGLVLLAKKAKHLILQKPKVA